MLSLITFEGGEGAGKSTLISSVASHLTSQGHQVLITREPGGTPLGEKIRDLLLHTPDPIEAQTELFLFLGARFQHVKEVIQPAIEQGKIVLCDRFSHSTIAYQSFGRSLPQERVEMLCNVAADGVKPDLTYYLDVPVEVGLQRATAHEADRIESQKSTFHERVRQGFVNLAQQDPNMVLIDATQSIDQVHNQALQHLEGLL